MNEFTRKAMQLADAYAEAHGNQFGTHCPPENDPQAPRSALLAHLEGGEQNPEIPNDSWFADLDLLARYVGLNLNDKPAQQALILRKLGKLFAELKPNFKDEDVFWGWLRDNARSWLAYKAGLPATSTEKERR